MFFDKLQKLKSSIRANDKKNIDTVTPMDGGPY